MNGARSRWRVFLILGVMFILFVVLILLAMTGIMLYDRWPRSRPPVGIAEEI